MGGKEEMPGERRKISFFFGRGCMSWPMLLIGHSVGIAVVGRLKECRQPIQPKNENVRNWKRNRNEIYRK